MSAFTLIALLLISGMLIAGSTWTAILYGRLTKEKSARERAERMLELNRTSVLLAREILAAAERKDKHNRDLPAFLLPILPRPKRQPVAADTHKAWKGTTFEYEHLPGNLRLTREDVDILDILRSPGTLQDILLAQPALAKSLLERLDRLHRCNLLEKIDEGRYVTSHEGHVHGLMTVAEGVVFSHVSKKPSKSMSLSRTVGDSQGPNGEIREALDALCERGYMERDGNNHNMVPMPSSPSLRR